MKYILLAMFGVLAMAAVTLSTPVMADEGKAPAVSSMSMTGYIVDTKCATANKDKLDEFVKTHPKDCAIACKDTGYNLYSDGKLWKFDDASSAKVLDFLQKSDSLTHVKVEVTHGEGDMITLVSIANAQ